MLNGNRRHRYGPGITLLCLLLLQGASAQAGPDEEVIILHDNDLHFHFNHAEAFRKTVETVRESRPNVFLFSAGDILTRHRHRWAENTIAYYERMAATMIEALNQTGYQAMTLGNHEIDYQEEATRRQLERAEFPLLGANVSSHTALLPTPEPYVSFRTRGGRELVVLGVTTGSAPGVRVSGQAAAIRRHLHLRERADLFILLSHIGYRADLKMAQRFPQLDLIIGGHSHTLLSQAELVNGVLVAQAGGHPHVDGGFIDSNRPMGLGVVQVVFIGREISTKRGRVFFVDSDPANHVAGQIEEWLQMPIPQLNP